MTILLLRGLGRELRHWGEFPERLKKSWPDARVVTLDLPGVGSEVARKSPSTIAGITADLRARWQSRATQNEPLTLVGLSLGGMVAIDWSARYPQEVKKCVVINASVPELSSPLRRLKPQALVALVRILFSTDSQERERKILAMTSNLHRDDQVTVERWASLADDVAVKRSAVIRQLVAAATFDLPDSLQVETVILASENDRMVDVSCSKRLAAHFNLPIALHPSAGHDLPLDDPDWVIEHIVK